MQWLPNAILVGKAEEAGGGGGGVTTRHHLAPRLKKEQNYTSSHLLCLRDTLQGEIYLARFTHKSCESTTGTFYEDRFPETFLLRFVFLES
jgi:hypothetical protein